MKIQIDPLLRQSPWDFVEIADPLRMTDEQKRAYIQQTNYPSGERVFVHFGFYIKTNIADLFRVNDILQAHVISQLQLASITKSQETAQPKSNAALYGISADIIQVIPQSHFIKKDAPIIDIKRALQDYEQKIIKKFNQ